MRNSNSLVNIKLLQKLISKQKKNFLKRESNQINFVTSFNLGSTKELHQKDANTKNLKYSSEVTP